MYARDAQASHTGSDFPFKPFFLESPISLAIEFTVKFTVKSKKIGTPEIITIIVLQMKQLDLTVQYCVQKMQIE